MNRPNDVDPLSLRVFANLFSSVADDMGITLQQAAFSPNIKMRRDFSCAIFDTEGRLLAQAAHIPVHLGAMPLAMQEVRSRFSLQGGDVVIMNDPFAGGTHLPDISLVSAAFTEEGIHLGYVMSRAHHADVGGMSPGSMPLSTEIYQEGMIIPPLLLVERGQFNEPLLQLLLRNVRTPDDRRGDFAAQLAAQRRGERGLADLASRYGVEALRRHGDALQAYSEQMMRRLVEAIPPGTYGFSDALDNDGQGSGPITIAVAVTRRPGAGDLTIDFSDSAPQCGGSLNAVRAVTVSAALYVMRCLLEEDVPVNDGALRPLHVITPPGSVVAALPPAAVAAGNVETSQRIVDVLFGALAQAMPDASPAASQGTMNNLAFGGHDVSRGRQFAYYETMGGGMGARPNGDGASGVHDHMSNTLNTPIEALESEYPLRVLRYSLRRGTGGAGRYRGGDGLVREIQFLTPTTVSIVSERREGRPYGLHGGQPGTPGANTLRNAGGTHQLGGKVTVSAAPNDVISLQSPGGGGFGRLPA